MTRVPANRVAAARELGRFVASVRGQKTMRRNGFESEVSIFPAHESDTLVSVMARLRQQDADKAIVAVHFPSRERPLALIAFEKGEPVNDHLPTGGVSTVGLLADYLMQVRKTLTVDVSQHVTVGALELAAA